MTAKRKSPRRSGGKRKAEADRLAEFLRAEKKNPRAPEVLVPKSGTQQLMEGVRDRLIQALKDPRGEILGRAEKAFVEGGKKLLQVNRQYGLSISGLVRSGALRLLSIPKRPQKPPSR